MLEGKNMPSNMAAKYKSYYFVEKSKSSQISGVR